MRANVFQQTLFPSKDDFDWKEFSLLVTQSTFNDCIGRAASDAIEDLNRQTCNSQLTKSTKSTLFHDLFIHRIKDKVSENMCSEPIRVELNDSGNIRHYVEYDEYVFIIRKNNRQRNSTNVAQKIEDQECDKHIIIIQYDFDKTYSEVRNLSFVYSKSGVVIYQLYIDQDQMLSILDATTICESSNDNIVKPVVKVKSSAVRKAIAN